jgi:hypothetical protein
MQDVFIYRLFSISKGLQRELRKFPPPNHPIFSYPPHYNPVS